MAEREVAPLDSREAAQLRAIAQELTRTDPQLLREPPRPGPRARPPAAAVGVYLLLGCVLIGTVAVLFGKPAALVSGAVVLGAGVAARGATGRPSPGRAQ